MYVVQDGFSLALVRMALDELTYGPGRSTSELLTG